jgi:Icc-related predicted phosphoesterase
MKIQYCSDLHLEFPENNHFLGKHPLEPAGDVLLLAGDILPFALHGKPYAFIDYVADHFDAVYWIPGNHEYYGFDLGEVADPLLIKIRSNVFLVNNQVIPLEKVNLVCSTLWSHISPPNEWDIQQCISDFSAIRFKGRRFTAAHFNQLHERDYSFIKRSLTAHPSATNIVMTHHVPTLVNYPSQYKGSFINEAFATELHDFIATSNAAYWIYGHHHTNTPVFKIGNTSMLTNQLGYVRDNEHGMFRGNALLEIL